ncbi:Rho termination factor N-terminal domain-containing protein, partial [Streptomyces sp. SR27]
MSDTTDLMGVTADSSVDTPAPAAGAATGGTARRRRSGTGLDGMVLAELQQVASGLGIRGTARMRKSQLIEVIKEAQAGGSAAPAKTADAAADTKPKRRATAKARTGETAAEAAAPKAEKAAEKAVAPQQIDIPGQPASEDQPAGERRRRRATAPAGSPEGEAK